MMADGDTTATKVVLKKDGTPKAKRGEGQASKPKPAYLVFSITGSDGQPVEGTQLTIHKVTRKAEDVLAETSGQDVKRYQRIEI
jgi:hypothetical protein